MSQAERQEIKEITIDATEEALEQAYQDLANDGYAPCAPVLAKSNGRSVYRIKARDMRQTPKGLEFED